MKFSKLASIALVLSVTDALVVNPEFLLPSKSEFDPELPQNTLVAGDNTEHVLAKREAGKKVVWNKDYVKNLNGETSSSSSTVPDPWLRTIYGSIHEVVTPTVLGGITFRAKPTETSTNGLEPWVSLKKDGAPKTIRPKMKNGRIQNGLPDYKHYFETATTVTYDQAQLKAHNLKAGDVHEEVTWIPEDQTYVGLSPLMRCTPDYYRKKEGGHLGNLEPFCSPNENSIMRTGQTYFLTWYTRYFEGATHVKVHYAYVKESAREKGVKKRALETPDDDETVTFEGDIPGTFYSSAWIENLEGFHAIQIEEEWLKNKPYKKVLIAVQPDTVDDDEFDLLASDHVVVKFQKKTVVAKNTKADKLKKEQTGTGDDVYYVILTIPGIVMIAVFGMYMFLYINRKHRDVSHIKKPKRSRFGNKGYLPLTSADIHPSKVLKQSKSS